MPHAMHRTFRICAPRGLKATPTWVAEMPLWRGAWARAGKRWICSSKLSDPAAACWCFRPTAFSSADSAEEDPAAAPAAAVLELPLDLSRAACTGSCDVPWRTVPNDDPGAG